MKKQRDKSRPLKNRYVGFNLTADEKALCERVAERWLTANRKNKKKTDGLTTWMVKVILEEAKRQEVEP